MPDEIPSGLTIRVYALIINDLNEVLVTDEFQLDMKMTKFPGGGMNLGEGTIDCLRRELREECNQEIEAVQHFYTTDFYQKALFWENHQLISVYYVARLVEPIRFRVSEKPFDFPLMENGNQSFRWVSAENIIPEEFTFPIDKHVAHLLNVYLNRKKLRTIKIIGPAYPYRGGIATTNERLAQEFASMGFEVELETFILQYPSILFPGKTQYNAKKVPEDLKIKRSINSVNPFNWIKVGRRIGGEKPDLVIIRYWMPFLAPCLGTIAGRIRKNKHTIIICLADNIVPHEHHTGDRLLTNYFIQRIHGLIAMSKSVLTDATSFRKDLTLGYCPHPIFDNYGERLSFESAKRKLNLDLNTRYLLFFGFIRDYKGLDLLIKAFSDERLQKYPVKLLVAGEYYSSPEPYLTLIKELNLEDRIELRTDFIPDDEVNLYFSAADIVVQPYKSATQSGVTQIGYHFNKPMLVTNVGGLSEIIPDGVIGYVVEPESGAISDALVDFYEHERITNFETNIVEEKKKFSWSNMVETFTDVYNQAKSKGLEKKLE